MPSPDPQHELHELHHDRASLDEQDMPVLTASEPAADVEREALIASRQGKRDTEHAGQTRLTKAVVRKLDTLLVPFLALLFLLNSLDKSNIGNAETAGFTHDTGLSRGDVNTSMSVFFFVFVLLQPFGAAVGRRFGMKRYVPTCMSLWGLCTILHIFVRAKWQLVLLRAAIATLESGFYPTTVSYLSLFYTKYEFAFRLAFFYSMTAISGMLGGILSWAVFSGFPSDEDGQDPLQPPPTLMQTSHAWKSWEILFLIEGCLTMTVALAGFFWLPRSADTAWFLTSDQKQWAEQRMRADLTISHNEIAEASNNHADATSSIFHAENALDRDRQRLLAAHEEQEDEEWAEDRTISSRDNQPVTQDSGLSRQDILSGVFATKIWHLLLVNILSAVPATAFGVLLPILIKELSPSLRLSAAASNLLSAPPFALGAIVLFAFTFWSDRSQQRVVPILGGLLVLIIGLILTLISPMDKYWLRYFSLCILLSGSFVASPLTVAWIANNTPEPGKRAIMLGINGWGNLAGVFMSVLFTPKGESTGYVASFTVLLVCALISFAGFIAFYIRLLRENNFRDKVVSGWSAEERQREELFGDVPIPDTTARRMAGRLGILALARRLQFDESRRGDDKLTYRYSL